MGIHTEAELMEHLRRQGITELNEVASAYIEGESEITLIKKRSRH